MVARGVFNAIEEIARDNRSGATALASRGSAVLALAADLAREEWEQAAVAMARSQPAMAPLLRLANAVLLAAEAAPVDRGEAARSEAARFVAEMQAHAGEAARRAASLAMGARVLVHSASSLVAEALLAAHAAGGSVNVICTESRPALEGLDMARRLGAAGIPTRLVSDAAAPAILPHCDLLLLGADAICVAGVVHKAGTFGLAIAGKHCGIPAYVLATDEKLLPKACGRRPPIPPRDPAEILPAATPGVEALNFYYDITPQHWFAGILTERGMVSDVRLRQRLREIVVHPTLMELWVPLPTADPLLP